MTRASANSEQNCWGGQEEQGHPLSRRGAWEMRFSKRPQTLAIFSYGYLRSTNLVCRPEIHEYMERVTKVAQLAI